MENFKTQVDKKHYFRKKYDDLNRFISYFYQIDLATEVNPETILEIGKGNGTVSDYLKKLGYKVTTADIDASLAPDQLADVRKLPFQDGSFDLVTACEILEHIPFEELPVALSEIARVSKKYVLISVPYRSTGLEFVLRLPLVRTLFKKPFLDFLIRLPLKFGGIKVSGQHYWEIDCWQYRLGKVRRVLRQNFKIVKELTPVLNYYHRFFLLSK